MQTKHSSHKINTIVFFRKLGRQKGRAYTFWNLPTPPNLRPPGEIRSWHQLCWVRQLVTHQERRVMENRKTACVSLPLQTGNMNVLVAKYSERKHLDNKSSCIPSKRTMSTMGVACPMSALPIPETWKTHESTGMVVSVFGEEHKDQVVWGAVFQ